MDDITSKIIQLIDSNIEVDSTNRLELGQLRENLLSDLDLQVGEIARFPELAGEPFFSMLVADYDSRTSAMFILVAFDEVSTEVVVGLGDAAEVRGFGEEYLDDQSKAIQAARGKFRVSPSLHFPRQQFESWLTA